MCFIDYGPTLDASPDFKKKILISTSNYFKSLFKINQAYQYSFRIIYCISLQFHHVPYFHVYILLIKLSIHNYHYESNLDVCSFSILPLVKKDTTNSHFHA
jgi:hypothetical protein